MKKLTGITQQFKVTEKEWFGNDYYLPGIYGSHNLNDAEPMRIEFFIELEEDKCIISNDLDEAMQAWRELCNKDPMIAKLKVKKVTKLG